MKNQKQKGISSLLGVVIVIGVGVLAIGGVLAYQYLWAPEEIEESYIKVLSPDGGEEWKVEETYEIKWDYRGLKGKKINICLIASDGEYGISPKEEWRKCPYGEYQIASDVLIDEKKWNWLIPEELEKRFAKAPDFYRVDLIYIPEEPMIPGQVQGAISDSSDDYFTIVKKDETTDWEVYRNEEYRFEIKYPNGTKVEEDKGLWEAKYNYTSIRFSFPFTPGTKLENKSLRILIREKVTPEYCFGLINWHGVIEVNGIEFHYIPGFKWDHAMGGVSFYASDYSTMRDNNCIFLEFRLGLRDPTGFVDPSVPIPPDPPEEDLDTEVFDQMLSTFRFIE